MGTQRSRRNHQEQQIRYVGLNDALLAELRTLRDSLKLVPTALVFPNEVGSLRCLQNLYQRSFLKCIKAAELRRITIHDLRHTFAAHYVMNGGSIYDLKQILGHSDLKMTERYAHLAPDYLMKRTALVTF